MLEDQNGFKAPNNLDPEEKDLASGFVYMDRQDFNYHVSLACSDKYRYVTEGTWKMYAKEIMTRDVKIFDQYLKGHVYKVLVEEETSKGNWKEAYWNNSFYSDAEGEALYEEAKGVVTALPVFDTYKEAAS